MKEIYLNFQIFQIQHVVIDFTHSLSEKDIKKKFWKEYQDKNTILYVVLTNPDASSADTDYDSYLNGMPDDRYPDHVKVILQDDFNTLFGVEKEILGLIDKLDKIIEECLDDSDRIKQKESLEVLYNLNEKVRRFLKFPLSQQRLVDFSNFFNF